MRAPEDYRDALLGLLPPGRLLPRRADTTLAQFLLAWGDAMARLERRALALLAEADPRSATETIAEWEADFGLPDPCAGPALLLAARRAQVVARMTSRGGQSIAYFVALAAALGYAITIEEPSLWTCVSSCTDPLTGHPWEFAWIVHAPEVSVAVWTCLDPCAAPLRSWGNALLECAIKRSAPADTYVLFFYATALASSALLASSPDLASG